MMMLKYICILLLIGLTGEAMAMKLTSKDFTHEGSIPQKFTCEGEDKSPELSWTDVPAGAKSLVLICYDPDAPDPKAPKMIYDHWVLFNLPADSHGFKEGLKDFPKGTGLGKNSWGRNDYGGPCPPIGVHRYYFNLYAVDKVLDLPDGSTKQQVLDAIKGHELAKAELMGTYIKVANR
jgi:Raf kinase inhibitor-like YbhB/YbcL family protein